MDMKNIGKNQSKDVFRFIPPWLQKCSYNLLQWDYMKGSRVDEDRALGDTGGEQMAHTNETVCVCVCLEPLPKPLWAAAPSLHQRSYSSQPMRVSLTTAKQHGGCTKSEMFTGSPGTGPSQFIEIYLNILPYIYGKIHFTIFLSSGYF